MTLPRSSLVTGQVWVGSSSSSPHTHLMWFNVQQVRCTTKSGPPPLHHSHHQQVLPWPRGGAGLRRWTAGGGSGGGPGTGPAHASENLSVKLQHIPRLPLLPECQANPPSTHSNRGVSASLCATAGRCAGLTLVWRACALTVLVRVRCLPPPLRTDCVQERAARRRGGREGVPGARGQGGVHQGRGGHEELGCEI